MIQKTLFDNDISGPCPGRLYVGKSSTDTLKIGRYGKRNICQYLWHTYGRLCAHPWESQWIWFESPDHMAHEEKIKASTLPWRTGSRRETYSISGLREEFPKFESRVMEVFGECDIYGKKYLDAVKLVIETGPHLPKGWRIAIGCSGFSHEIAVREEWSWWRPQSLNVMLPPIDVEVCIDNESRIWSRDMDRRQLWYCNTDNSWHAQERTVWDFMPNRLRFEASMEGKL